MLHDTAEWYKVWRKTDSWFQKWHEEFGEFSPSYSKIQKLQFDGLFLSKVYNVWAKKMQRSYLSWHRTVMQKFDNPDLEVSKMAWRIGWTFIRALKIWKIVHWWLFLSKAYNFSARKFQRNYVSWHWRLMQNLKENWLVD